MFQSTHSLRSATPASSSIRQSGSVSIHALLAECDLLGHTRSHLESCFNPRTPCGVRHGGSVRNARTPPVSIHALLAECDTLHALPSDKGAGFNPRTPCGVRPVPHHCLPDWMRFNPRTPCGVRLPSITIRALPVSFQSTHSLRSATPEAGERGLVRAVSIHALLAECDVMSQFHLSRFNRFNPRTPCGVRHAMLSCAGPCRRFQSTHSLRSATGYCWTRRQGLSVSIHALLAECDEICNDYKNQQYGFNPRTPCGVRLSDWFSPCPANQFQSTHSLRSATNYCTSG